jgi:hypothetical protein
MAGWTDEQKRCRYPLTPLVAACITGGTIDVSIFKAAGRRLCHFSATPFGLTAS